MRSEKTIAELTAWLSWDDSGAKPDAQALADFLGIELAEPEPPVGQRRRSPEGVEVIKTDGVSALCWQRYAGVGKAWFSDAAIADWQIVTDAPCRGWYDVPHDGIHDGPSRHPNAARQDAHSACRPCRVYTGRDTAPTP